MAMNEQTNASVAARPTPSAPAALWKPRWQLISAIAAPKKQRLDRARRTRPSTPT